MPNLKTMPHVSHPFEGPSFLTCFQYAQLLPSSSQPARSGWTFTQIFEILSLPQLYDYLLMLEGTDLRRNLPKIPSTSRAPRPVLAVQTAGVEWLNKHVGPCRECLS